MKKVVTLLLLICVGFSSLAAIAADRLEGILTLAIDDVTALRQVRGMPGRHVMIYFGDYQN